MSTTNNDLRISVLTRATCPHCWAEFAPEDILWIAAHPELNNDPLLSSDQQRRFLPSRFNVAGNALDIRGMVCQELACPHCHLVIPRSLLELPPVFISIAGTPACGKSYFLAAMTWMLRNTMPHYFRLTYADADAQANSILTDYEEQQFLNPNPDKPVKLRKTEVEGDFYDQVLQGGETISYPRPFMFTVRPTTKHPSSRKAQRVSRLLCLYDNAGESFLPGADTAINPVTRHLAKSDAVMFCFDPTQDPRFRAACEGKTDDYQVVKGPVTARQEIVLHEVTNRIREHAGLKQTDRRSEPLIVVVTKCDAWWPLMEIEPLSPTPWNTKSNSKGLSYLDLPRVQQISDAVRELLSKVTPELVATAEEFSKQTWFIPVTATGGSPELFENNGEPLWAVRPRNIKPIWCEVPMLLALAHVAGGLIPVSRK